MLKAFRIFGTNVLGEMSVEELQMELDLVEAKLESISLGYEVGMIQRSGKGWLYSRLEDRSSDDSAYIEIEISAHLQSALVEQCLLTDPDGQPDIHVFGDLDQVELRWWLAPIIEKWGEVEAYLNGDLVEFYS